MSDDTKKLEMTLYNFPDRLGIGKRGEQIFEQHAKNSQEVIDIKDVSNERKYFSKGIDYIIKKRNGAIVNIDVKCDTYSSGNFFIEIGYDDGRSGCIYTTEADYWFYIFVKQEPMEAWWLNIERVREYMESYGAGWFNCHVRNIDRAGNEFFAIGSPIPKDILPGVSRAI